MYLSDEGLVYQSSAMIKSVVVLSIVLQFAFYIGLQLFSGLRMSRLFNINAMMTSNAPVISMVEIVCP